MMDMLVKTNWYQKVEQDRENTHLRSAKGQQNSTVLAFVEVNQTDPDQLIQSS